MPSANAVVTLRQIVKLTVSSDQELTTSVVPGPQCPGPFYEKIGFAYTGEVDDGEMVMKMDL